MNLIEDEDYKINYSDYNLKIGKSGYPIELEEKLDYIDELYFTKNVEVLHCCLSEITEALYNIRLKNNLT